MLTLRSADLAIVLLDVQGGECVDNAHADEVSQEIAMRLVGQADRILCIGLREPDWMEGNEFGAIYLKPWTLNDVHDVDQIGSILAGLDWIKSRMGKRCCMMTVPGNCTKFPPDLAGQFLSVMEESRLCVAVVRGQVVPQVAMWSGGVFENAYKTVLDERVGRLGKLTNQLNAHHIPIECLPSSFKSERLLSICPVSGKLIKK